MELGTDCLPCDNSLSEVQTRQIWVYGEEENTLQRTSGSTQSEPDCQVGMGSEDGRVDLAVTQHPEVHKGDARPLGSDQIPPPPEQGLKACV